MFDFLSRHRPDMMIFANRDAVRVNPRFDEIIIPVEWREEFKSRDKARETLQLTNRAVQDGKATVLFPSGRIAFWNEGRLTERPWKVSAVTLAGGTTCRWSRSISRRAIPACSTGCRNIRPNSGT